MPRFYFTLLDGDVVTTDEEGAVLKNLDDAVQEARRTLACIAKDLPMRSPRREFAIEIGGEDGRPLARLALALELDRLG